MPESIRVKKEASDAAIKPLDGERANQPKSRRRLEQLFGTITDELLVRVLFGALAVLAGTGLLLTRVSGCVDLNNEVRKIHRASQYDNRRSVLADFASGIPQNEVLLSELHYYNLYLNTWVLTDSAPNYFDGRSFLEISEASSQTLQTWALECKHYYALCYAASVAFDPDGAGMPESVREEAEVAQICVQSVRELFDLYNEITVVGGCDHDNFLACTTCTAAEVEAWAGEFLELLRRESERVRVPSAVPEASLDGVRLGLTSDELDAVEDTLFYEIELASGEESTPSDVVMPLTDILIATLYRRYATALGAMEKIMDAKPVF